MVERFAGLDVSQRSTSVCILDGQGKRVWRGKCATDPAAIEEVIRARAGGPVRVGVETGPLTPWLVHELRGRGLEVVCLDARQARAALALRPNKTDANDAEGLAQILRLGWHRSVHVKSYAAHRMRAEFGARMQLVNMVAELSNHVRGVLKVFGLVVEGARGGVFADCAEALVADRPEVAAVVRPMLEAWRGLRRQVAAYDLALRAEAKDRAETRLLMSERAGGGRHHRPGLRQRGRGSGTLRQLAQRRRAFRAHPAAAPVGRGRPHRGDLALGRRAGAHLPVRGRHSAA